MTVETRTTRSATSLLGKRRGLEATGSPAALDRTIDVARPRGAIVLDRNQPPRASVPMTFIEWPMRKGLTIAGCFRS